MKVQVTDNTIVITLPLETPRLSQSGKTYIVAGTGGFARSDAEVKGKPVSVSVNVTIPK